VKHYQTILTLDPKNTTVNYRMGMIFYNRKDYKTAKIFFTEVLILYPFDYDCTVMLAWCQFQLAAYPEAKTLFQKALVAKPADKSATEGLSLIK
jgi:Tfp pilus assembly protein PilF